MDVAVLAGGRSPEHDISLASAAQALHHLDRQRWRPWPVFLDRDGSWWPAHEALGSGETWQPGDRSRSRGPMRPGTALDWLLDHARVQVVLPVLHGAFGEDGTVQGMLELHDVPCVGSGCAASAVAMDKIRTRQALLSAAVRMPRAYVPAVPLQHADAAVEFAALQQSIGLPCFVKLDCSGSTVGVECITDQDGLHAFFTRFRGTARRWYAEALLRGEEITVGVLGNSGAELQPLPPIGIYPVSDPYFTHAAKYQPGATRELIPPRGWSEARCAEVQAIARLCHETLQCDGMSRTDMIVTADGPMVLEVNTIPGLTRTSLLPQAAAAAGLDFAALLDHLLQLALQRAGVGVG